MQIFLLVSLASSALAARTFLNEPDIGLEAYLAEHDWEEGTLPPLDSLLTLPDFDFAARQTLTTHEYSYYRTGSAGEWSYRGNLEVWSQVKFRPRQLRGLKNLNETMPIKFLGYDFSAPFFIGSAARAEYGDPENAELNFVDAAAAENIPYLASLYADKTIEEIGAQKHNDTLNGPQVTWQQLYTNKNMSITWENIHRAENANAKAIVFTIDAPISSIRPRISRYDELNGNDVTSELTWDLYDDLKAGTDLPVIPKGIATVEDALIAVEHGAPAIYLSNHGGRQLDHSPSPLEIAYEIYRNAPQVFEQTDVMADGGVRYGSDVIKLLALGVKMVGIARPFMYANCYGVEGVTKAIQIMKSEILADAANAGITDLRDVSSSIINTRVLEQSAFIMDNE